MLICCGETNYILKDNTPPVTLGFLGFRWTTPMSIVESEFPKQTEVVPISKLNNYNSSNFSGSNFLGYTTSLCQFTFDQNGLNSVKLIFQTNSLTSEEDFFSLKEKLTKTYGNPLKTLNQNIELKFIQCFSWDYQRLQLILTTDNQIEIYVYRESPLSKPITNI